MRKISNTSEYRQLVRQHLIKVATQEFESKGIKAVRMDDIANLLSVSKRTVYELFGNKENLLLESVRTTLDSFDREILSFAQDDRHDVIDIVLKYYSMKTEQLSRIVPAYFIEIEKYPSVIRLFEEHRKARTSNSNQFFKRGIKEGFFIKDGNYELIVKVADTAMQKIMADQLYMKYDFKEIFNSLIMVFLRGLCTSKGIKRLDERLFLFV